MIWPKMNKRKGRKAKWMALAFVLTIMPFQLGAGAAPEPEAEVLKTVKPAGAPVVVNDQTLFYIQAKILSISPENRAQIITERITKLAKDPLLNIDSIVVSDAETTTDIVSGELTIMTITEMDAAAAGRPRLELANENAKIIKKAIQDYRKVYGLKSLGLEMLIALIATAALILIFIFNKKLFLKLYAQLYAWKDVQIHAVKFQKLELISSAQLTYFLVKLAKGARASIIILLLYFYLLLVLGLFPWTRKIYLAILGYILSPLEAVGRSITSYLPNLFFLLVIILVAYYGLKLIKLIFTAMEKGSIVIPGFYSDWARPTYKIVRLVIIAFATVVAFPYLPGSGSSAFKGVSIFAGVLLSFGSAGAISNAIAGVILTYMRAFKIGDRVKIADTVGDIIDKTLLVTRIRTIKNEEITVPNSMVLGSHIVNYSASAKDLGLILHSTVTIGYNAPWRKVHELLIAAARATDNIKKEPVPFVFQTALNDFYVSYEINAYTDQPNKMAVIYADLHRNIQDKFNEAGVEIMSPHYSALRDGNATAMPGSYLPKDYQAPGFQIPGLGELFGKSGKKTGPGENGKP